MISMIHCPHRIVALLPAVIALALHSATPTLAAVSALPSPSSQCLSQHLLHNSSFVHDAPAHAFPRGGGFGFPAGWHPFGYAISDLGKRYLEFEGSRDGDVGRFLSSLMSGGRKSRKALREQWLEITRVSKKRQSMRIYRTMDDLIDFCLEAGFIV